MKSLTSLAVLTVMFLVASPAHSAPKKNFDDLAGTYKGALVYELSPTKYAGTATVTIAPSGKGKRGIVVVSGTALVGGVIYPVVGVFEFGGGNMAITKLPYLGLALIPGSTQGLYVLGRKAIVFTGANTVTPALTASGTFKFRFTKKKRILTMDYGFFSGGSKITGFTMTAKSAIPTESE